jgi:hypothetical protein
MLKYVIRFDDFLNMAIGLLIKSIIEGIIFVSQVQPPSPKFGSYINNK